MSVILQNGIIAVPNQPTELLEQYKEQQLHIQRLETAVQKLIDENENLNQKIDGLMTSKVVLHADMEDKIASQNDKIARQNDMIASETDKNASQTNKIASLSYKIDILQEKLNGEFTRKQNELKSKIYQTAASVEEMKNTPKVAFRATCAKKGPYGDSTYKNVYPVIWKNIEYNIGSAFNASNGKFTCPHDGIYSFYATSTSRNHGNVYIYVNGSLKSAHFLIIHDWGFGVANPTGVFKLTKGDTVHIQMHGGFNNANEDCVTTYFQGHLIDLL